MSDPADVLQERLERAERESAARQQQLERYAEDMNTTFRRERARAQQLVRALCNAVEARDAYTSKHAERVAAYALRIAEASGSRLANDPMIEFGFLLHDVGKVAVPDAILFKPGPLTPEERKVMESHTVIGAQILKEIDFLGEAKDVVRSHHERWDGAGYPDGLAGKAIPHAARVFSVADVLDALTTRRPYREPLSMSLARAMIIEGSSTQFDPAVVDAFATIDESVLSEIQAIE